MSTRPMLLSAALWSLVGGALPAADALRKPNVIVFLVDDMG